MTVGGEGMSKVALLSVVDMSRVLGMLYPLVPTLPARSLVHHIFHASPDTGLANSPRPWGQERAVRGLGFGLAYCHYSEGNTTQMCVQKYGWYITGYQPG